MPANTFVSPPRAGESRRSRLRRLIHQPWFEYALITLIVVGCVLALVEVRLQPGPGHLLSLVDHGLASLFLTELALRGWTYRNRRRFLARYWLDIVASLPLPAGLASLRFLRLLRIFRLLRVGAFIRRRHVRGSGGEFAFVLTIGLIVIILGASVISALERRLNPDQSLGSAFWWSLFSMMAGEPMSGIPDSTAGRLIAAVVTMTGLCVFAILTGAAAALMSQRLRTLEVHAMDLDELEDHIIICGWDRRAPLIIEELQHSTEERERPIVVVAELRELPPLNWQIVDREKVYLVPGDFTKAEMLEKAGIRRAAKAIIVSDKSGQRSDQDRDARTILAALTIEKLNRDIYTCAELLNREHEAHLRMAGVEDVVCASEYGATLLSSMAIHSGISTIIAELLSVQFGNEFFKLDLPARLEGKSFREVVEEVAKKHALAIALERPAGGKKKEITLNPEPGCVLMRGDRIVVISRVKPDMG